MKKKTKKITVGRYIAIVVVVLAIVFSLNTVIQAQIEKSQVAELTELANAVGDAEVFSEALLFLSIENQFSFGASGSRFPNGISADTTSPIAGQVRGTTLNITATSTFQEITFGSRYSVSLDFTAGNTSTPGKVGRLENTGQDRVCSKTELGIFGDLLDDYSFSVTTSSSSGGDGKAPSLIASTTRSTSTQGIFNNIDDAGSADMDSWLWKNGVFVEVAFGQTVAEGELASSTAYTSTAIGNMYVACHTQ